MTNTTEKKKCECRVCLYSRKVRDLIHRTQDTTDKALIEELFDKFSHVEDDHDYLEVLCQAYRLKHGPMSFSDACHEIDRHRAEGSGQVVKVDGQ